MTATAVLTPAQQALKDRADHLNTCPLCAQGKPWCRIGRRLEQAVGWGEPRGESR